MSVNMILLRTGQSVEAQATKIKPQDVEQVVEKVVSSKATAQLVGSVRAMKMTKGTKQKSLSTARKGQIQGVFVAIRSDSHGW